MYRRLILGTHEEYGELGWAPTWIPGAEPMTGMSVGYDCLERFHRHPNGMACALMSLGATLVVRDRAGWFAQQGRVADTLESNMPSDIEHRAHGLLHGEHVLLDPGCTRPLADRHEDDALFRGALQGFTDAHAALYDMIQEMPDRTEQLALLCAPEQAAQRALGWMRRGVRATERRYKGIDPDTLSATFDAVVQAATDGLSEADGIEGARLCLRIHPDTARVDASVQF